MDPDVPLVVVLVLGDVGRSPRMQYHALSLARTRRARVRLVGFRGERCVPEVEAEADTIEQTLLTAKAESEGTIDDGEKGEDDELIQYQVRVLSLFCFTL